MTHSKQEISTPDTPPVTSFQYYLEHPNLFDTLPNTQHLFDEYRNNRTFLELVWIMNDEA